MVQKYYGKVVRHTDNVPPCTLLLARNTFPQRITFQRQLNGLQQTNITRKTFLLNIENWSLQH